MTPGVGGPSHEYRAVCAYSGPTRGQPECGEPATLHVLTVSDASELVALATCDRHAGIARRAGDVQDEHEHQGVCGLPGTVWVVSLGYCEIDDSGVEPELVGVQELEAVQ